MEMKAALNVKPRAVVAQRPDDKVVRPGGRPRADHSDELLLLRSAAGGSAEAFRVLVDRHLGVVYTAARRMLRDDAAAEDVAQEAMLRLWQNGNRLELGDGGVRPWLRRVASNLAIDRLRRSENEIVTDELPDPAIPAPQLKALERRDTAAKVRQALDKLPDRQRLALALFHFEGHSQNEVGAMMGVSAEAVESLLARARRTLKVELKDEYRDLASSQDS